MKNGLPEKEPQPSANTVIPAAVCPDSSGPPVRELLPWLMWSVGDRRTPPFPSALHTVALHPREDRKGALSRSLQTNRTRCLLNYLFITFRSSPLDLQRFNSLLQRRRAELREDSSPAPTLSLQREFSVFWTKEFQIHSPCVLLFTSNTRPRRHPGRGPPAPPSSGPRSKKTPDGPKEAAD